MRFAVAASAWLHFRHLTVQVACHLRSAFLSHHDHRTGGDTAPGAEVLIACVADTDAGERLDSVAARLFPMYSRSRLQRWIVDGLLTVDERPTRTRQRLIGGETLRLSLPVDVDPGSPGNPGDAVGAGDALDEGSGRKAGSGSNHGSGHGSDHGSDHGSGHRSGQGPGHVSDQRAGAGSDDGWTQARAEDLPLPRVHVDESIHVVDKPAGLVMHPAPGNPGGTLVNALLHHDPALRQVPRAGVVHRLDKDTSGLCVVARSLVAHTHIVRQLQDRSMGREYLAVVIGDPAGQGKVDAPIGRHPKDRKRMAVVNGGRHAVTYFRVLERFDGAALLGVKLETGRTHQIRVHMSHVGLPLIGDPVYGRRKGTVPARLSREPVVADFPRQALHAVRLTLNHPDDNASRVFESPWPADLQALIDALRLLADRALPPGTTRP